MATIERIGLIAGNGRFPLLFAEAAKRAGVEVVAVAHQHETPDEIANLVAQLTWVRVGELGKIIRTFKQAGVARAVMAGGIRKPRQLSDFRPDFRGAAFIASRIVAATFASMIVVPMLVCVKFATATRVMRISVEIVTSSRVSE